MRRTSVLGVAFVALGAASCGGSTIDYGSPGGSNNTTNPNRPNPPGVPTLAQGGDFTILPGPGVGHPSLTTLVGSSPTDIWGAGTDNGLYHWDGNAWSAVPIGAPASTGDLKEHIASAGPGGVWIAHAFGVVRVDTSGNAVDFTSQIGPGVNDAISVDASSDLTVVTASSKGPNGVFSFDGTKFTALPALPGPDQPGVAPGGVAVRTANEVWITFFAPLGDYFDGTTWQAWQGTPFMWPGSLVPFAAGKKAEFKEPATVCPDWCHPASAPHGQTISSPWQGGVVDIAKPITNFGTVSSIPAPDDIVSSLAYYGVAAEPAADGNLAFVGCAFPQTDAATEPQNCTSGNPCGGLAGYYVGQYVVHEWDGTALHTRAMANSPECAFQNPYMIAGGDLFNPSPALQFGVASSRPLTDGTWILPAVGSGYANDPYVGAAAILMKP